MALPAQSTSVMGTLFATTLLLKLHLNPLLRATRQAVMGRGWCGWQQTKNE